MSKKKQVMNPEDLSQELAQRATRSNQAKFFPVVALGGSAGSFHAIEKFFLHMPVDSGFAFVIVMHLDPTHNIDISGLLQHSTGMPIIEALDGTSVEPNKIFVIPPDKDMGIHNGNLLLFNASRSRGAHMSIDYFLQSLAEDQWNHAVAVIFSGMGADGETGVRMIKEKLGMAMVQSPDTAEYPSMPSAAIKSGLVDYILSPEEMPVKLIQYLNHPALKDPVAEELINERNNQTHLQKILMLLRSQTGHDFTLYKKNTITRRVERRIAFHQLPDYLHYVNYIRENPHEIDILFKELLIGVTKFFRDIFAFDLLRDQLYANLVKKGPEDPIRIWVAGCSTGEEAYTIAILIMEYLGGLKTKRKPKVQIFATDLDANAIEQARMGFYFSNIISEISPERIERFFVKKNNGYVVKKEVRELIVFAQHNLIKDAPFTKLDLLTCRNVMIYLTADLQKKLIPVFHYSINESGLLLLGPAESVGIFNDAFNVIDNKWKLYERKGGVSAVSKVIDFPFNIASHTTKSVKEMPHKPAVKSMLAEHFHKILIDDYAPSALLINEKGEIIYINGKMDNYLQLHSGDAALNIHKMAREELKYILGNAIHQTVLNRTRSEFPGVKLLVNGKTHLVDLRVDYLDDVQLQGLLIIVFSDKGPLKKRRSVSRLRPVEGDVEELEKELNYTKQQLNTTIEQMETSLEELKSTNEELQSTNEELQSTNEEALTTKEEMQSLNEELMTINLQYQNKAEELTRLNNDMKNLLDNTEIGTIFLDNQLNILRFTPQVTKLFSVIPSDIGRSITHIASNFDYPSIENAVLEVIERLNGRELEVKTKKDEWYNLRIMPYRTMDNFISGAVLTFTKITPVKALESKLSTLLSYVQVATDNMSDAAVVLDADRKVLVVNSKFLKLFHLRDFEIKEHFFIEIVHNKWNTDKLDKLLLKRLDNEELYVQHEFPGIGIKKLIINATYFSHADTHMAMMVVFKELESG
ncbi:MAG TPA: CheR family methyltransferase [Pedobacter sp.]|nr:CheR family methyltransferase [Pedobacter sp.]